MSNLKTRQNIYINILNITLNHIRDIQHASKWQRWLDWVCYYEADLIHNIPYLIHERYFVKKDVYFLNASQWYFKRCNAKKSPIYNELANLVRELFLMIPDEMKSDLTWEGP